MAEGIRFVCGYCGHAIESWSDGNPYYLDEEGNKQYAYHPDHKRLDKCIGNDVLHICLSCGQEFMVDSLMPVSTCPKCHAIDIVDTYQLDGRLCPFCKAGTFVADPEFHAIS